MTLRRLVAFLLFAAAPLVMADAPGVWAIAGGTVHPGSGPAIPNGIVVIRAGLIEAVGANVAVPADATVIDAGGSHVYPGLIDAHTSLGFGGSKGKGSKEESAEPTAADLAARAVSISSDDASARLATGVTTIVTAPSRGIFNGQSVILNLGDAPLESRVVKSPAALNVSFNPRPAWTYPDSLMGVIAHIRQTFLDAQHHAAARETYERAPSGLRRPADRAELDALRPALRRELPVVFVADGEEMVRRALSLARELNVRPIVAGAREAFALTADLRDVPTLVAVNWPIPPTDPADREEQPLRVIRRRLLAPTSPSALAKAGASFALVSGAGKASDFLPGIRKAIANGLDADAALRATTLAPARIFGVDRQLGSLERGKIANVVISDRPLFERGAKVTRVFVDGSEVRLPAEEKKTETAAAPGIDGTWSLSVAASEGSVAMQVTLRSADGGLTGTYSGDRGSGEIRGGSLDGDAFEFSISTNAQNDAESTEWLFRGRVEGDSMIGTVSTNLGTFTFSGSRAK
jgi:imidazolonepropionase-like amidohydrolase